MSLSVEVQLRAIMKVNQSPPPLQLWTEMVDFNFNRGDTAESAVGTFKNFPTYTRFRGEHNNELPAESATNTYLRVLCQNLDLTNFFYTADEKLPTSWYFLPNILLDLHKVMKFLDL